MPNSKTDESVGEEDGTVKINKGGRPPKGKGKGSGGVRKGAGAPVISGVNAKGAAHQLKKEYNRKKKAAERKQEAAAISWEEKYPSR